MRAVDAGRAVLGGVLLACPGVAPLAVGEQPSARSDLVVRVLAGRMLAQACAGALAAHLRRSWRGPVARGDAAVEALHSASMIGLGLLQPEHRRLAFASAALAGSFAVADAVQSTRHGDPPVVGGGHVDAADLPGAVPPGFGAAGSSDLSA